MLHDIKYTVAENIGRNPKEVKNRKLDADKEWLDCFKQEHRMICTIIISNIKIIAILIESPLEDDNDILKSFFKIFKKYKINYTL